MIMTARPPASYEVMRANEFRWSGLSTDIRTCTCNNVMVRACVLMVEIINM